MIRPATPEDIPRLVELGAMLHSMSSFSSMAFSPEKTAVFLEQLIGGLGVVFVSVSGDRIVGGMAGAVMEQWFSQELIAYEYAVFVEPTRRHGLIAKRLIETFEQWAIIVGAKRMHIGIGTGLNVEGTSRLYRALGFNDYGPQFIKELG